MCIPQATNQISNKFLSFEFKTIYINTHISCCVSNVCNMFYPCKNKLFFVKNEPCLFDTVKEINKSADTSQGMLINAILIRDRGTRNIIKCSYDLFHFVFGYT